MAMGPEHFYVHIGENAVKYLFRIAYSIDSMMLGETEIGGQIQTALDLSNETGAAGSF